MGIAEHPITPEDVHAYVDGELTAERAAIARAHLETCAECRKAAKDVASVSRAMSDWQIETAPESLHMPNVPASLQNGPRAWTPRSWQVAAATVLAVGLVWLGRELRVTAPRSQAAESLDPTSIRFTAGGAGGDTRNNVGRQGQAAAPSNEPASRVQALRADDTVGQRESEPPAVLPTPMIARTAMLTIVVPNVADARAKLDRSLEETGGFVGHIDVASGGGGTARLTATVLVPSERLVSAITVFKQLGRVVSESQGGEDVTTQVVDLDARIANARETERRLVQVLQQRTGKVGDVLEVEREISRVRESIERMSAQRGSLGRRVTYATITLGISEEERAELKLDRPSVARDLRNALVDGMKTAGESALWATAFLMRIAPTVALWAAVFAWPAILLRRRVNTLSRR